MKLLSEVQEVKVPAVGTFMTPEESMKLAISEAYKGATAVAPNPLVGCVVLDSQNKFLSSGYHEFYGGPHAEVNALKKLSALQLQGAHVFVTLEPCAHEGKTPSCAKMLIKYPIAKVIYGLMDPNPLVSGQGAEIIRAAGIQAEEFQGLKEELNELCEVFLWNYREKKVFITAKLAATLDGKTAQTDGTSQWITGEDSRDYVHYLRACYDAVAVGKNTVLTDNPALNIRHPQIQKKNKIIIFDFYAEILKKKNDLQIFKLHAAENIFLVKNKEVKVSTSDCQVIEADDLAEAYQKLYEQGVRSVFLESGGKLLSTHLEQKKLNRLYLFQSNQILGDGRSWSSSLGEGSLAKAPRINNTKFKFFKNDYMLTGKLD